MKRLNVKLVVWLVIVLVVGAGAIWGLHSYQVARNARDFVRLAEKAEAEGDLTEAVRNYQRYLHYRPDDKDGVVAFALTMAKRAAAPDATKTDVFKAHSALEMALRQVPDHDELLRRVAQLSVLLGRMPDAVSYYQKLLSTKPKDAFDLQMELIVCYQRLEKNDQARELLEKIIEEDPSKVTAYMSLAQILTKNFSDPEAANVLIDQMVEKNPNSYEAYMHRGRYRRLRGMREAARSDIEQALKLNPDASDVCLSASELEIDEQNYDRARELLEHALKFKPNDFVLHRALAAIDFLQERTDDAIERLKNQVGKDPRNDLEILLTLIDFQLQKADAKGARESLDLLRSKNRNIQEMIDYQLARILMVENQTYEASRILERIRPAFTERSYRMKINLLLAGCYGDLGQRDLQQAAYEQVLLEDPLSVPAHIGLATALMEAGRYDDADRQLATIEGRDPRVPLLRYNCQIRSVQTGDLDVNSSERMERLYEEMVKNVDGKSSMPLLMKSDMLMRQGKHDEAKAAILEAREKFPEETAPWQYLAALARQLEGPEAALAIADEGCEKLNRPLQMRVAVLNYLGDVGSDEALARVAAEVAKLNELPPEQRAALWQTVAQVYYRNRKLDQSLASWREVLNLRPNDPQVHAYSFRTLQEMADDQTYEQADRAMQAALDEMGEKLGRDSAQWNFCSGARLITLARKNYEAKKVIGEPEQALLEQARQYLAKALDRRPDWFSVYSLRGDIEALAGRNQAAIEAYQTALDKGETNPAYIRRLVSLLMRGGDIEGAKAALAKLRSRVPELPQELQRQEIIVGQQTGHLDDALRQAETILKNSDDPRDLLWYGQLLAGAGRISEALEVVRQAVAKDDQAADSWLTLMQLLTADRQFDEALKLIDEIREKVPDEVKFLVVGQCYDLLERPDEAEQAYQQAIQAMPDDTARRRVLVTFYLRRNQLEKADAALGELLALKDTGNDESREHKAWARRMAARLKVNRSGDYKDLRDAQKMLEENRPASGQIAIDDLLTEARLLATRIDGPSRRRAIQLYEQARERSPIPAEEMLILARLYETTGNWGRCRTTMYELVGKEPKNAHYLGQLIRMLLRRGEIDDASIRLETLRTLDPHSLATAELRIRVLGRLGRIGEAIEVMRQALPRPLPPQQVGLLAQAGQLLEDLANTASTEEANQLNEAAHQMYKEYALEDPAHGNVALARYLGRHGQPEQALDLCQQQISPKDPDAALQTAVMVLRFNSADEAIKSACLARIEPWIQEAIAAEVPTQTALLSHAEVLQVKEQYDQASNVYRQMLTDPKIKLSNLQRGTALNNLAFLLAVKDNNGSEAMTLIQQALDIIGPIPDLLDTRAMAYLAVGNPQAALSDLQQAVADSPDPFKYFHLALAHYRANDKAEARRAMESARGEGLTDAMVTPIERKLYQELVGALAVN